MRASIPRIVARAHEGREKRTQPAMESPRRRRSPGTERADQDGSRPARPSHHVTQRSTRAGRALHADRFGRVRAARRSHAARRTRTGRAARRLDVALAHPGRAHFAGRTHVAAATAVEGIVGERSGRDARTVAELQAGRAARGVATCARDAARVGHAHAEAGVPTGSAVLDVGLQVQARAPAAREAWVARARSSRADLGIAARHAAATAIER